MSQLEKYQERIKVLEERNTMLEDLAAATREVSILVKQKMESQEQELQKIKVVTRFIWN